MPLAPHPSRRRGGRPRAIEPRTLFAMVRLSRTEKTALAKRADGVPLGDFIRRAALRRRATRRIEIPSVNAEAWIALARTGANLNQIAHHLNAGDNADASNIASALAQLHEEVRQLRRQLICVPKRSLSDDDKL
jgi:hypothetical protein